MPAVLVCSHSTFSFTMFVCGTHLNWIPKKSHANDSKSSHSLRIFKLVFGASYQSALSYAINTLGSDEIDGSDLPNLLFIFSWLFYIAGDIQVSTYPGRIIVTENPKGFVQPRINVEKHSMRHVVVNGQTMLPCIAQGHPVPTYRWVKLICW